MKKQLVISSRKTQDGYQAILEFGDGVWFVSFHPAGVRAERFVSFREAVNRLSDVMHSNDLSLAIAFHGFDNSISI